MTLVPVKLTGVNPAALQVPTPSTRVSHFRFLFFSLRSETKRNRNRFASFSLRFAKLKKKFFASFRFFLLQFFTTCDLEGGGGKATERLENRLSREEMLLLIYEK